MRRRTKAIILIVFMALLTFLIAYQSVKIYNNFHHVKKNFIEGKTNEPVSIHRWLTVAEISEKYHVSEKEVFEALRINPEKGDEKRSLRVLRKKYNISTGEMKSNLERLIKQAESAGKKYE